MVFKIKQYLLDPLDGNILDNPVTICFEPNFRFSSNNLNDFEFSPTSNRKFLFSRDVYPDLMLKNIIDALFIKNNEEEENFILYNSIVKGYEHIVEYLLKIKGLNPNKGPNVSPLTFAVSKNYLSMVKLLLTFGADIEYDNGNGITPLAVALQCNQEESAFLLIDSGADIFKTNKDNCTMLHYASFSNNVNLVRRLLELHVDPNLKTKDDVLPLHMASSGDSVEVVKMLCENTEDPLVRDRINDANALIIASSEGSFEIFKYLLEKGFDPNSTDNNGFSVIMHCAMGNFMEKIKYLLENYEVDLKLRSVDDETVLDICVDMNLTEIQRHIQKFF
eukprot:TRINITY_DN2142_c0_g1_i1.p1 TRINITY_DN2142_c0_g1~~TRINITY_DN2142_c0_g1_i1.p1  ORF type:complete len:334 (+),score=89.88 TRINITY_DN2142_c0_g1_i1:36-1037(+)